MSDSASETSKAPDAAKSRQRLGCLAVVVVVVAGVVGGGYALNKCEQSDKSFCERYAKTMARELDNCHSGVNRSHRFHIDICERRVNPTDACLEKIKTLSCPQLEASPPSSAPDACAK